jgi:hypothetical protein
VVQKPYLFEAVQKPHLEEVRKTRSFFPTYSKAVCPTYSKTLCPAYLSDSNHTDEELSCNNENKQGEANKCPPVCLSQRERTRANERGRGLIEEGEIRVTCA